MALVLCLETATDICSVALGMDGNVIAQSDAEKPYSHVSQINILIQDCLEAADIGFDNLEAVAISAGPGSYTGLRVGASVAKGICFGRDLPLISIGTLEALAHAAKFNFTDSDQYYFCPVIDARRMEVYTATFNHELHVVEQARSLIVERSSFDHLLQGGQKVVIMGDGMEKISELLSRKEVIFSKITCSAVHLVPIAQKRINSKQYSDPSFFTPFYLKSPHITKAKKFI